MNMHAFCVVILLFLLSIYLGTAFLGYLENLRNYPTFVHSAEPFYISISNVWEFPFLCILNNYGSLLIITILVGVK